MPKERLIYDIETTGLDPREDKIICIGLKDVSEDKTTVINRATEEETVEAFLNYCRKRRFDEVIGYKIDFDDRFVFAKALKYNIHCQHFFSETYHIDLMSKLKTPVDMYSSNNPGSLDEWVGFLFDAEKSEDNGGISDLYSNGEVERIEAYCEKDVELTFRLWRRINRVLG